MLASAIVRVRPGGPYYGWVLAWALGWTTTVSWGIVYYAFSVFLQPMEAELGWSRAQLSGAFTVALLVSGAAAVPGGRWIDRHGARVLMTSGSVAGSALLLVWANVRSLPLFYGLWVGMGLVMAATLYDPAFAVIAAWFRRRRAHALTLVTLMAGLASTIFLPLAAWLVERQGWRAALVSLAALLALATIPPHAFLLRRRPADLGLRPDGDAIAPSLEPSGPDAPEALAAGRSPTFARQTHHGHQAHQALPTGDDSLRRLLAYGPFRWLLVAYGLYALASVGVGVHLVPYLTERGFAPTTAAAATGLVGAAQLLGRIAFAPAESRLPRRWLTALVLLAQPLALLVLQLGTDAIGVYVFIFLFGISRGAATLARANVVAAQYGAEQYGSVNGTLSLFTSVANAFAPLVLAAAHDVQGTYIPTLWVLTGLGVAASAAAVRSDPSGHRDLDA